MEIELVKPPSVSDEGLAAHGLMPLPPPASRLGDVIFVGGHMAVDETLHVPDSIRPVPGYPWHGSSMERQLRYIYENLAKTLEDAGSSIANVAKINSYHTKPSELDMALRMRKEVFGTDSPPPSTLLTAADTLVPEATVVLDVTALSVETDRIPVHVDPSTATPHKSIFGWPVYVQAIRGAGLVFTAGVASVHRGDHGQLPSTRLDPSSPYSKNVMRNLTAGILGELRAHLAQAGCTFDDVVKADIYIADAKLLAILNEVWASHFSTNPPARTITPLPLTLGRPDKLIEVELIAVDRNGPFDKEVISTRKAPAPLGPEPQAVRAGPYLFLSTQLATDYQTGVAPEARVNPAFPFHASSVKQQVRYILHNVEQICLAAGTSLDHALKRRVAHTNLADAVQAEEVWADAGIPVPPTTWIGANETLTVPGCIVQYDLTVGIP